MNHRHLALELTFHGHLMLPKATCHPDRLADAVDIRDCAICGTTCYVQAKSLAYLSVRPTTITLCCGCSEMTDKAIMEALPGSAILSMEVPDLARGGMFN